MIKKATFEHDVLAHTVNVCARRQHGVPYCVMCKKQNKNISLVTGMLTTILHGYDKTLNMIRVDGWGFTGE